jgi:glycosyltransferase involved in cell wall biosynthesis
MYLFVLIRPDVVQTWLYHADLLGGLAARSVGVRNVLWGIRTTDIKSSSFNLKLIRWVLARLSGVIPKYIICAAEAAKKSHIRIGYDAKKMIVIPNGYVFPPSIDSINGARFLIRQNLGIIDDHIVVGSMGRFHSDKDHENFVKAAILLLYKFPKLQFLMVGCDVNTENLELMSLIDFSGFRSNFLLLGQRNDPQVCFSAMDIFCLHSRTEAFPNVLVEAMGSGIPCVATNVGDAELILSDTGVLVPKEDYFALSHGLASLISLNKEELRDLGLRARASVEARFSIRNAREQFDEVYSRTMKNRSF